MSTGLESVQAFFNLKSQTSGIESAMGIASPFITFTIWATQVVGFLAIGIWMLRIVVDIVCLTTKNMGVSENLAKFGTGKDKSSYDSVKSYITTNGLEIVMMVILFVLMTTGLLYRILSLALGGVGTVLNFVFKLDLEGITSATDADAFVSNLAARKPTNLRNEYDERVTETRGYADQLYQMAQEGTPANDPNFQKVSRAYTTSMSKAELIAQTLTTKGAVTELKVGPDYFKQHTYGSDICNTAFLAKDTIAIWKSDKNINIKCR